jgi:hypothetical protein
MDGQQVLRNRIPNSVPNNNERNNGTFALTRYCKIFIGRLLLTLLLHIYYDPYKTDAKKDLQKNKVVLRALFFILLLQAQGADS